MKTKQAQRLGQLVARARHDAHLSMRQVEERSGIPWSWIARLELGHFATPDPGRLARLAELLGVDPQQIDGLTGGGIAESLPEPRTYFRAKYGDLTAEQEEQLRRLIEELRREET